MLINFKLTNYRSFLDSTELSMITGNISDHPDFAFKIDDKISLLRSVGIFGKNASGKTNLVKGLNFMKNVVLRSVEFATNNRLLEFEPFQLIHSKEKLAPSTFEINFIVNNIRYNYGFSSDDVSFTEEWLTSYPKGRARRLFDRKHQDFFINKNYFKEGVGLEDKTRENTLFLTVVSSFAGNISSSICDWFNNLTIISGLEIQRYLDLSIKKIHNDPHLCEILSRFLEIADFSISKIESHTINGLPLPNLPPIFNEEFSKKMKQQTVSFKTLKTHHKVYDNEKVINLKEFDLLQNESQGTIKFIFQIVPIIESLIKGSPIVIDEFDSRLHYHLSEFLINLFNNPKINQKKSQLIYISHNGELLNNENHRRDQIWFVEKNFQGKSSLYSLLEFKNNSKKIRKDASYGQDYKNGKYGSIPILNDDPSLIADLLFKKRKQYE